MNARMAKIYGFFTDADGSRSYGRAASAYCIVASLLIAVAGLWLPSMASYCAGLVGSFLLAGAGFYGTSKGQQVLTNWVSRKMTEMAPPTTEPSPMDEQK